MFTPQQMLLVIAWRVKPSTYWYALQQPYRGVQKRGNKKVLPGDRLCGPPFFRIEDLVYCVCVCIPFIVDVRLVDVPAGVTEDFSSTFLLRCLLQFLSREGFNHPFPSSTVKSTFVYP